MFEFPSIAINVFAKVPVLGTVKTRMQPALPTELSLTLHTRLVEYCLRQWQGADVCPLQLWLAGDMNVFNQVLPQWSELEKYTQQGDDLGERLYCAAKQTLLSDQYDAVILVGTDVPFITPEYLREACRALATHDVVIGPANDGGYVLLGIKSALADLFNDIQWGTETVFEQTIEQITKNHLSYHQLPVLSDIDRPEDLPALLSLNEFQWLRSVI